MRPQALSESQVRRLARVVNVKGVPRPSIATLADWFGVSTRTMSRYLSKVGHEAATDPMEDWPLVVRAEFAFGGQGVVVVNTHRDLVEAILSALAASPRRVSVERGTRQPVAP